MCIVPPPCNPPRAIARAIYKHDDNPLQLVPTHGSDMADFCTAVSNGPP